MSWSQRALPVKAGDEVCYSAAFLRSVGAYTGDMPHARGVVTGVETLGGEIVLANVTWDIEGLPERVNVKSLSRVSERGVLE